MVSTPVSTVHLLAFIVHCNVDIAQGYTVELKAKVIT